MKQLLKHLASFIPALQYRRSYAKDHLDQRLEPFIGKRGGFFLEAGANDGISQSNTLYFERYFGWTGILVEPAPALAALCRKYRPKCIVEEVALASRINSGPVELTIAGLMTTTAGAFADMEGYSADKHLERAKTFSLNNTEEFEKLYANTNTISQILENHGSPEIDLLSLDVEGYEEEALMGLDLSKHRPHHILIEERYEHSFQNILGSYYRKEAILAFSEFYQDTLYKLKE